MTCCHFFELDKAYLWSIKRDVALRNKFTNDGHKITCIVKWCDSIWYLTKRQILYVNF